jgi:hypothetical protein
VTSTGQGVVVSASGLVGPLGCGVQSSQVFKYVAVLRGAAIGGDAVGTFDCFADAAFANLSILADGTKTVSLSIRAFNKQSYEALGAATWAGLTPEKALVLPAPWTTECSAVPLRGVRVLAQCPPLQPSADAGVMDAGSSSDADAGLADAADATASDADSASTDGASDGASDASDAAAQDANGQDASDGAPNG